MRAITIITLSALSALWGYYGLEVARLDTSSPTLMPVETTEPTNAASLNNTGVQLDRRGRRADALAFFQRAHSFRPDDAVIAANYEKQEARVVQMAWARALGGTTVIVVFILFGSALWRGVRRIADRARLSRLRLHGNRWMRIDRDAKEASLSMRFSHPVHGLSRRHKPNVVWTCAAQNQHMKSRRSVKVKGRECRITLDKKRLQQLRKYPGEWRCILRLGDTEVGEAAARGV